LRCASCVIASQYATSIVNRCWSGFPCKWQYINVATLNLLTFLLQKFKMYRQGQADIHCGHDCYFTVSGKCGSSWFE